MGLQLRNKLELVTLKAGTGRPIFEASGLPDSKEVIDFGKIIGVVKDKDTGAIIKETTKAKLHYCKATGVRIVSYVSK